MKANLKYNRAESYRSNEIVACKELHGMYTSVSDRWFTRYVMASILYDTNKESLSYLSVISFLSFVIAKCVPKGVATCYKMILLIKFVYFNDLL